jgi:hypothetical protein
MIEREKRLFSVWSVEWRIECEAGSSVEGRKGSKLVRGEDEKRAIKEGMGLRNYRSLNKS